MAERGTTGGAPVEGLAGGPGPTPPGFDDGTPKPLEDAGAGAPGGAGQRAEAAREARPERSGAARGDPEEPDPS